MDPGPNVFQPTIILFRGTERYQVGPFLEKTRWCDDTPCESLGIPLTAHSWSPTGAHFMLDVSHGQVNVYRTSDLRLVHRWVQHDAGDYPAHEFLDDTAIFELHEHSRVSFYRWDVNSSRDPSETLQTSRP
jgi:hypothetical protein